MDSSSPAEDEQGTGQDDESHGTEEVSSGGLSLSISEIDILNPPPEDTVLAETVVRDEYMMEGEEKAQHQNHSTKYLGPASMIKQVGVRPNVYFFSEPVG